MRLLKVKSNDLDAIFLRGQAFAHLGELDSAQMHYDSCLKWDQNHLDCSTASVNLKNFRNDDKEARAALDSSDGTRAMPLVEKCFEYIQKENLKFFKPRLLVLKCKAFVKMTQPDQAIPVCDEALQLDAKETEAHSLKGEAYIQKQEFEEAIRQYQKGVDAGDQQARNGLENAKKLLKISLRKDYYKILEIEKFASLKEIKKAYHRLALIWHPDKNKDNPEADKKFKDIVEANEVFSDEDKRGRYDRGEDVEQSQQGQGWNPFQGGPFSGFNFQFRQG